MRKISSILLCFLLPIASFSQLSIVPNNSATAIAQAIVGNGISISNASLRSGNGSTGMFTYSGSNLGLTDGIILTTGLAAEAANPGYYFCSVINNANYTDPDVVAISPQARYDVCILEFEFIPLCDTLRVTYVFGSEEYPRYISLYNDVFALFLSGPNPAGGNYTSRNMATLPNGITPVSINTINGGWPLGSGASNPAFYVDNYTIPVSDISYDGYTIPITSAVAVVPCQTYHMKITVVDALNGRYDSGVFLQSNTFSCTSSPVTTLTTVATCTNTGRATATVTNYSGTPTFLWLPDGQTTATITNLTPGSYTCIVTYPGLCSPDTLYVVVDAVNPTLLATTGETICIGSSAILSANANDGTAPYTYYWMNGGAPVISPVSPATTTTYTVTASDVNGCWTPSQTVTITVKPPITVLSSPNDSICPGNSANLSVTPSGGNGNYFYSWSPSTGLSGTSIPNPQAEPIATTNYQVTVSDDCGTPPVTTTILIKTLTAPVISITADQTSGCIPLCVQFTDPILNSCLSANWEFGDGQSDPVCTNSTHCYTAAGTYDITHQLTNASGCTTSIKAQQFITVYPTPDPTFIYAPQTILISNPLVLFQNQSQVATSWLWDFGDSTTSVNQLPQHTYSDTGCYAVQLNVMSAMGCIDSSTTLVCVEEDFSYYIPNAFSPNNDGINEIFQPIIKGSVPEQYEFTIYDRWGLLIFKTNNVNEGWNGNLNNGKFVAQQDVYVWKIVLYNKLKEAHTRTGRVTLIK